LISFTVLAEDFSVVDANDNDIPVQHYPADGNLLVIWLVDHDENREMFERMLDAVHAAGIEIWRVDLLESYFLPRTSENERTLSGDGVAAVLGAAHDQTNKTILLAAYDRMPLALLRGVHLWQQEAKSSRLAGAVLFYPNLFGPAPVAGEKPQLDPVLQVTNIPVVIYQPETGALRWRLDQVLQSLWQAGSPAMAYLMPGVRDWFFMGEEDPGPEAKQATARIPQQLKQFARVMDSYPKPEALDPDERAKPPAVQVTELVRFNKQMQSPGFDLPSLRNGRLRWDDYAGQVTLVNFWATWCPPCVEEVPSLNRLGGRFTDRQFAIVSIDYRETPEQMKKFLDEIRVDFPVLLDMDGKTSLQWNVFSFPSSFLIDKQGRIRYTANRAIDWDTREIREIIERLMAE
jgi:thiol-disulfide isomerase/thioredoxin